jgi:hypothetical protein
MFGQAWWLVAAVLVGVAVLLWCVFEERVRPLVRLPLVVALTPVVTLAAAIVGITLPAALSGPYESPPRTTERTASPSPTASPSSTPTPSASPTASPSASPSP